MRGIHAVLLLVLWQSFAHAKDIEINPDGYPAFVVPPPKGFEPGYCNPKSGGYIGPTVQVWHKYSGSHCVQLNFIFTGAVDQIVNCGDMDRVGAVQESTVFDFPTYLYACSNRSTNYWTARYFIQLDKEKAFPSATYEVNLILFNFAGIEPVLRKAATTAFDQVLHGFILKDKRPAAPPTAPGKSDIEGQTPALFR